MLSPVRIERDNWKITAYCPCEKCCGRYADGYFASGLKAELTEGQRVGYCACNVLPFDELVESEGLVWRQRAKGKGNKEMRLNWCNHCKENSAVAKIYNRKSDGVKIRVFYCINKGCGYREGERLKWQVL